MTPTVRPATPADRAAIETLLDAAFGPARRARTAARLREGAEPIAGPSLVACAGDGSLIASIEYWRIALVTADATVPLTLLGPLAVAPERRDEGHGRRLLAASLTIADAMDLVSVLLIGDAPYYGPFGFSAAVTGGWELPGPVERDRLLLRQATRQQLPLMATVVAVGWGTPDSVPAVKGASIGADA